MTHQRILATIGRDDFVGRDAELHQITRRASRIVERPGLVLLAAPDVGASELLRQAYDQLFSRRGESIPLYFAFKRGEAVTDSARRLFQSGLQQYIAYRRVDPDEITGSVPKSGANCSHGHCDEYVAITCQR